MCVLFESSHSIGEKLFTTLIGLIPSIDYFYTSSFELLENLPMVFEKNHQTHEITSSSCLSSGNSNPTKTFQNQHESKKSPSTSFCIKVTPSSSIYYSKHHFDNLHKRPYPDLLNHTIEIFSQKLNKHSIEDFSNFKVSNNVLDEGSL